MAHNRGWGPSGGNEWSAVAWLAALDRRDTSLVLWISLMAPYDCVPHAGGQTANYYVKRFGHCDKASLRVLSFCSEEELEKLDLDAYGIANKMFVDSSKFCEKWFRRLLNFESRFNPFNRYVNLLSNHQVLCISRELARLASEGYRPDVVILQWTEMVFLTPMVKRHFPECRVVSIEEDVTFVRLRRESDSMRGMARRTYARARYLREKALELRSLEAADLVSVNNCSDRQSLLEAGLQDGKLFSNAPYFTDMSETDRAGAAGTILFFGAMNRKENYEAALWFIDNVIDCVRLTHDVDFVVLGGSPPEILKQRSSPFIRIVGYVEDIRPYFETAVCLVAPLMHGAGIKVKVLEAMSAGMPVLTTRVGIEGIPAIDGREFFLCESPEQYVETVDSLLTDADLASRVGSDARVFVHRSFNTERSVSEFIEAVLNL